MVVLRRKEQVQAANTSLQAIPDTSSIGADFPLLSVEEKSGNLARSGGAMGLPVYYPFPRNLSKMLRRAKVDCDNGGLRRIFPD